MLDENLTIVIIKYSMAENLQDLSGNEAVKKSREFRLKATYRHRTIAQGAHNGRTLFQAVAA